MLAKPLPRFVIVKPLARRRVGFYFTVPTYYRKHGCTIPNEPLGSDYEIACGEDGVGGRAAALNGLFDEWRAKLAGEPIESIARYGTVDWLFREYKSSKAYLEKVSKRSRPDYERTMLMVADILTKNGDRIGSRLIQSITPRGADKIYEKIIIGAKGKRLRQGEKAMALCRKAWNVVRRLYPDEFDRATPNPWEGVTRERPVKKKKPAVTREQVYAFAQGCVVRGCSEAAAAAVICFEWLQRPENVLAGYLRWTDYRSKEWPNAIRIEHHKTGELVWHPLEETVDNLTTKQRPKHVTQENAVEYIRWLGTSATAEFDEETEGNPRARLLRFEHDRRVELHEPMYADPLYALDSLITESATLRFFASHTSPDQSAQLLALADRLDHAIEEMVTLKIQQRELIANIGFAGASPREVKEVRRELKSLRKLAA